MVYTGIFTTEEEIDFKTGANVSTAITESQKNKISKQIENRINVMVREDLITKYPTLSASKKAILSEIASNLIAVYLIIYDMSGYTSRVEAEDMITILNKNAQDGIKILKDQKGTKYLIEV